MTSYAYTSAPLKDASFNHLTVTTSQTSGKPPKDALFSNLTLTGNSPDLSMGKTIADANYTKIAVQSIIQGSVTGNSQTVIGRL